MNLQNGTFSKIEKREEIPKPTFIIEKLPAPVEE